MKRKAIERIAIPSHDFYPGYWTEVQTMEDILIMNVFKDGIFKGRHCVNSSTGEYDSYYYTTGWAKRTITDLYCFNEYSYQENENKMAMSEEHRAVAMKMMEPYKSMTYQEKMLHRLIREAEASYQRSIKEKTEANRIARICETMNKVPIVPEGLRAWIDKRETGGEDWCIRSKDSKNEYGCSNCGKTFEKSKVKTENAKNPRNNDMVICPSCGSKIRYKARKKEIILKPHITMIQPINDYISVARFFDCEIYFHAGMKKDVLIDESIRIIIPKYTFCDVLRNEKVPKCEIYYAQHSTGYGCVEEGCENNNFFDNWRNPCNRREFKGYLYDGGIEEALRHTEYECWSRIFTQMAADGLQMNYNRMMIASNEQNFVRLMEMLYRGKFYKLLEENSEKVSVWGYGYCGPMKLDGDTLNDAFDIGDTQLINRIRQKNGGILMMDWMRWSERHHKKLSDKVISWLIKNNISKEDMAWAQCRFSIEQAMNYIERQRKESYKGKSISAVINQYEDYMSMCKKLGKDTSDEMIYRPRELKRRHDEAVQELERRAAEIKAEEYSKKYPVAEKVLSEIRDKFEYQNEQFIIMVPQRIADIVAEGKMLHHCAGATDRYFDRIAQHETYICFLRKMENPDASFYTIEVEPGGTIRQHRGEYDEEPEIDIVKPFLREWQKEIRKRMKKEDHERAKISEVKREENIADLRAKKNERVLKGLMEDFMAAVG